MTVRRVIKGVLSRLLPALTLLASVSGCIKEDESDCEYGYTIMVKAYGYAGDEIGADVVKNVILFIFDGDSRFVSKVETAIGQSVQINRPAGEDIHLVAWGNLKDGTHTWTEPQPGDPLSECFVELELALQTRSTNYALPPGDLFRGKITVGKEVQSSEEILSIYREMGSLTVTALGLKGSVGFNDDDYSITVRETRSAIGFDGKLAGAMTAYRPEGSFVTNGGREEYRVPAFNLIPEETGIFIDIYYGSQLITTVSRDSAGNPIVIEKGRLTNVLVDFAAQISVSVSMTDWGDYQVWKEF